MAKLWSRSRVLALALVLILCLQGCAGRSAADHAGEPGDGRLRVVTTLFPYYDFVRQIAGDQVELTLVVPAGMDSHSFEPTPADMRTIQHADLLICNGGAMEHWVDQVLEAIDAPNLTVVTMMDYVDTVEEELVEGMEDAGHDHDHAHGAADEADHDHGAEDHDHEAEDHDHETETAHSHEDGAADHDHEAAAHDHEAEDHDHGAEDHDHEAENHDHEAEDHDHEAEDHDYDYIDHDGHDHEIEYDEHIWTSPVNAMVLADAIRDALCQEDPDHRQIYEANAAAYQKELERIDAGLRQVSENRKRNMIIVGDKFPFRYLAEEYQLDYRAAFSGCSTDTEPSARTIAYLIDKVRETGIPVVYYLELSSHRVSEIIGEETGAQPLLLHSCHNVTRAQFDAGITYVELMEQNIENLRKGLDE